VAYLPLFPGTHVAETILPRPADSLPEVLQQRDQVEEMLDEVATSNSNARSSQACSTFMSGMPHHSNPLAACPPVELLSRDHHRNRPAQVLADRRRHRRIRTGHERPSDGVERRPSGEKDHYRR
jgi:hypothetical protein